MSAKELELSLINSFIESAEKIRDEKNPDKVSGYLMILALHNLAMASFLELSAKEIDKDKLNQQIEIVLEELTKRKMQIENVNGIIYKGPKGEA